MWLRDHCVCGECYNVSTNQRKLDILSVPDDIHPISYIEDGDNLRISWSDGHVSSYNMDWLWKNNFERYFYHISHSTRPILWDGSKARRMQVGHVAVESFMNSQSGVHAVVESIQKFGVAFVRNVLPTLEATKAVALRLANIQRTLFGDMWEFSDTTVHSDTAYSKQSLDAHTDGTYLTESPGLQVFHCLHHEGTGGQTLLVDGFRAAAELKSSQPEVYDRLSKNVMEAHYLENGKYYSNLGTVFMCHPISGALEQVRYNLYDRAPLLTVPYEGIEQVYSDLKWLTRVIRDPTGEWWFKLEPGIVVFIDNWRVLHGRASYTATRRMAGCYLGRADYLSTARQLGFV
ncbi:hypothetical protein PR048_009340 [Dryococelus australis]|uniref:Trimethyllysine dioxygenase, mitochondrial n=1 Tax=Dryococelus australis TaxID=614101 RepID=A0ABQ9I0C1_9NEOP|nr:hypothetical protein PR048_009340 [Dryococelus australis]